MKFITRTEALAVGKIVRKHIMSYGPFKHYYGVDVEGRINYELGLRKLPLEICYGCSTKDSARQLATIIVQNARPWDYERIARLRA